MDKQAADAAITALIDKVNSCVNDVLEINGVNDQTASMLEHVTDTLADVVTSLETARKTAAFT